MQKSKQNNRQIFKIIYFKDKQKQMLFVIFHHQSLQGRNDLWKWNVENLWRFGAMNLNPGILGIENLFPKENDKPVTRFQGLAELLADRHALAVVEYDVTHLLKFENF